MIFKNLPSKMALARPYTKRASRLGHPIRQDLNVRRRSDVQMKLLSQQLPPRIEQNTCQL